ncbi:uncharacterized protein LOC110852807 [Folsomia candida]|uniref:Uncharacterized protein n=1 Tax=Folsomia candida TaxID=158441 RepID=A0A226E5I5_FOLCA|nr:uncharacterized protein LOC110852807 [Folsomia candida]OXA52227.1 hypothetical protein Fcan01_13633 [Folsomia candida]
MDRFVVRLSATPTQSTSTPTISAGIDTPPPSPAEQPPEKKKKSSFELKVAPPKRDTSVDWRSRVTLSDNDVVGFINSQEEFENLYSEGPPTPSSSSTFPMPSRKTESPLFTVRMAIFNYLQTTHPLVEFNYSTMESTSQYKDLMTVWSTHFKKYGKSDAWKAACPPGFTIIHDNQQVGVKFDGGRLFYKVKKEGEKFNWKDLSGSKCKSENCGDQKMLDVFCRKHAIVKREILLIRDVTNLEKVNIAIVFPPVRKGKFDDLQINTILWGPVYKRTSIQKYVTNSPTAWFVIEKRLEYLSEESVAMFQSLQIQMSLMVSLHNSVTTEPAEQIHFINCDITTKAGNLAELKKGLELNNMGFKIGENNNSLNFEHSPHLPTNFNNTFPFVYVGDNQEGGFRFGEDHAVLRNSVLKSSRGHATQITTMEGVDPKNIYDVFQSNPTTSTKEEILKKSLEVETLGHQSVLVAQMMGMKSVHGNNVYNLAEKFTHFDNGWDGAIFNDLVVMMTGKEIIVKKDKLQTVPTNVKYMVPIYKTEMVGKKERQVLDVDKMKKVGVQKKVYGKVVITWI